MTLSAESPHPWKLQRLCVRGSLILGLIGLALLLVAPFVSLLLGNYGSTLWLFVLAWPLVFGFTFGVAYLMALMARDMPPSSIFGLQPASALGQVLDLWWQVMTVGAFFCAPAFGAPLIIAAWAMALTGASPS